MHNQSNQLPEPSNLSLQEVRQLLNDLHHFKESALYRHYCEHFRTLFDTTIDSILDVELKGSETLYSREAWIGEARTAKLNAGWFEVLQRELQSELRELEKDKDNQPQ
jgi:hypothetical protein